MKGCLGVGQDAARALAAGLGKRLVGVHHMQAHALTPLLTAPAAPKFPFLILLLSGGHTQLVLAEGLFKFKILLDTLDSKIGDVFEKSARLLSLPTSLPPSPPQAPGAILEHYAALPPLPPYDTHPLPASQLIPIPLTTLRAKHTLAWSFAGMLASLQRAVHARQPTWAEPDRRAFSNLFQTALTTHLLTKLSQRIALLPPETRHQLGGMVVSGGVASNAYIRSQLEQLVKDENGLFPAGARNLYYPPRHLCTDNAAMIAHTALIRLQAGLKSDPDDLQLRAKWSLEDMYDDVPEEAYLFKGARETGMGL
ncbi:O-sialoglycoprotein endopeptidase [Cryptococcus neoformans C23]|uniref:N(6)-L-threonylcarbamoyladenine synthase n=1 Tax=Cryptococcus neoformans (strain H99 / ATCC 208821 / CBS 10515 / FGSC 9487) TaxID=235443 RepID=J9VX50_CRYN9|nr:O-sialoglycoprotein endopeptidase [Cryptococcus neoformans var. grubii H99]AFR96290.2 O-sialoglycoprotein endopeptidase [Cryptococcus neoformans var. grubii H99]AUB26192.1 O-sialoglycoprotein endopeptidase [Cryptococcus neoformans var. grubii]OWZ42480.1 O-sialoglycoprotein endopeptidase [Cryptococcus neoformans var. grubii C23]|eukprot:XP_012050438.1 O-sialoglycoprotein endopeptidase [Cryptococcus neoformans var. grubii H99]